MRSLREWLHRLGATLRPDRRDEDLEEELRLHLEMTAEEARRRGHDPKEAVRLARIEAGGAAQAMDALRDQRGLPWLEDLVRDSGYGIRTLLRRRGFAATAMLSLALGIGANTGIFSLFDQLLLRTLPVQQPDRLVALEWRGPSIPSVQSGDGNLLSYPLCRDLAQQDRLFDGVLCRRPGIVNVSTGGPYERIQAEVVSGSYFRVLGVRPAAGRLLDESDDLQPGSHPVVVLSHDYWRNAFGGAADVVGRRLLVNNHPMTVIGVTAEGFRGLDVGRPAALWVPAMMAREATVEFSRILDRRAFWMHGFARLKPGVTAADAAAGLRPWFTAMLEADSRRDEFPRVRDEQRRAFLSAFLAVDPAPQGWSNLRRSMARPMWALLGGTTVLLLLACLNVASLLLAREADRGHELSTRMALGASPGRIARQLIAESVIIALAGGLLGVMVAPLVSRGLLLFLPPGADLVPAVDFRVLLFALSTTLLAGVLLGIAPALQARRRPLMSVVTGRSTMASSSVLLRKLIVGAQLALTLVLLSGAGLFVQTVTRLYTRERGFDAERLLMFRADAGTSSVPADAPRVMRDLLQVLREVPSVERVAIANNSLLGSLGPGRVLTLDTEPRIALEAPLPMMRIGAGFFATLGARMIDGREFDERDVLRMEETGIRSIIVNESFARRFFEGRTPVGRRVGFGNLPDTPLNVEIIGLVSDFRRRFLADDAQPEHIFVPFAQTGVNAGDGTIYVRVRGEPEAAFGPIRSAVARVDPRLPLLDLTTLDDQIVRALRNEAMLATLSSGFGTVALLLSVVGLFGVMSFVVTQRTQEIGMRMALGATRLGAIWLIVRDALVTIGSGAGAGVVIGLTAAVLAAPWLTTVLYGISPTDVATFAATTLGLAVVALAACVVPAGRAAVMSPMVAIRDQSESLWRAAGQSVRRTMHDLTSVADRNAAPGALIAEVSGAIHRASSFPDAVTTALATLRDRVGARFILLLQKDATGHYRSGDCAVPAAGVLIGRLRQYPHPLPLAAGDFEVWRRWAQEVRPDYVDEIRQLAESGARMAVPLRTSHELVGILLLGPAEGRDGYTAADTALLGSAADIFALLIENGRLNERSLEQEKLRRDLALAAEVQRRLLPPRPPDLDGIRLAAFTMPARSVGGDYYDFFDLGEGRLGLAVADVAGKGVPAALLMSTVQATLRVLVDRGLPSSRIAAQMNRLLHQSTAMNGYATFFYAQMDRQAGRLRYVNAGHNPPYLVRRAGSGIEVGELSVGGTVIGLFPEVDYDDGDVDLRAGDLLVMFTDGVTEARNAIGDEFGEDRLRTLLRDALGRSPDEIASSLSTHLRAWMAGAEQHDDVTFVVAAID
jgi:predicted permease